jgi:hypothetical protein
MKKSTALLIFLFFEAESLFADMTILTTGRVLFGIIASENDMILRIGRQDFDEEVRKDVVSSIFRQDDIPDKLRLVVTLKDRSVIRGSLADYDLSLGLFIDIEYRILNVPWNRIADIYTAESIATRDNPVLSIYRLADGRIIIGISESKTVFKETIRGLGGEETIDLNKIDRVDVGIKSLEGEGLEITLRDHTVILGEIVGYDVMLGYLVDISFGTLNIPPEEVRSIRASTRRRGSARDLLAFGGGAIFMIPVVDTPVENAIGPEVSIQLRLPLFNGISVGQNARYLFMKAPDYPSLEYFYASVSLDVMVEVIPFITKKEAHYTFSPYLTLSGGAGIIGMVDTEYDDHQGGLDAVIAADVGVAINLRGLPSLRIAACVNAVAQDSGFFTLVGGRASLMF